jgi:hypothetical protein
MADSLRSARSVDNGKSVRGRMQKPGMYGKRIIRTIKESGREWQYHATKGWRSRRV